MATRTLRNVAKSLECEVFVRVFLLVIFLATEEMDPFVRVVRKEEFWTLEYPTTASYYPTWLLIVVSFSLPPVFVYFLSFCRGERDEANKAWLAVTLSTLSTATLTNVLKITIGRPRPDFLSRCFPNGVPDSPFAPDGFTLQCHGNPSRIREGRKSFPSGHSALTFSSIGFLTFYFGYKLGVNRSRGRGQSIRLFITSLPFVFSLLVAISRTCDYHHHWQDVTVGSVLGFLLAYLCYAQYLADKDLLQLPQQHLTETGESRSIDLSPTQTNNSTCRRVSPAMRRDELSPKKGSKSAENSPYSV